tara:strand:+ start:2447 stop:2713 length:267 start_codon:yes stop_codon:yes gene_type:complete
MPCSICKQNGHNRTTCTQNFLKQQDDIISQQRQFLNLELEYSKKILNLHENYTAKINKLRNNVHDLLFDNNDSIPEELYIQLMNSLKI